MADRSQKQTTHIGKSRRTDSGYSQQNIRISPERKRDKISRWCLDIRHRSNVIALSIYKTMLAFLPPLPKQKRKMDMSISQTALHFPYRRTGKKCDCWRKVPYLSSQYTQHRKLRQMRILQIIKRKPIKIDRV